VRGSQFEVVGDGFEDQAFVPDADHTGEYCKIRSGGRTRVDHPMMVLVDAQVGVPAFAQERRQLCEPFPQAVWNRRVVRHDGSVAGGVVRVGAEDRSRPRK
jgi:hypothetical protein